MYVPIDTFNHALDGAEVRPVTGVLSPTSPDHGQQVLVIGVQ